MNELASRVRPRYVLLAVAAAAVIVLLRRGGGNSEPIGDPLPGVVAPGFDERDFGEAPATGPLTIPLPPSGGVIVIPGYDPIVYEPPPPPAPPPVSELEPAPGDSSATAEGFWAFGEFWTRGELKKFKTRWTADRKAKRRPRGAGAWDRYLANHPDIAAAFGLKPPPPPSRSTTVSRRDSGHGGAQLAPVPGNRVAADTATRVATPARRPVPTLRTVIT